jgi:heptosyltransferase III
LIRPGAIGDCILALPALAHLKSAYTEVWIPSPLVPLVTFADQAHALAATGIDLVGVGDVAMPPTLQRRLESFDGIISWYGTQRPEFRTALEAVGPRCVFHNALPDTSTHAIDFFARQVGAPDGLCPHFPFASGAKRDTVIIHPFSGSRNKNWPLERFCALAGELRCHVEWIAGPEEDFPGALHFENLRDLAQHIAGARLYVGNDSGITHLAAALGVPTLALFGPTDPQVWSPRGKQVAVLREQPIENLAVPAVLAASRQLLANS